ncbi:MAG: ECF transporter S component [Candidatus Bathyarchaeota archaeon]|nr:ECF transporter S component [Candidatus Bathyarchaeota archaeon]
MKTQTVAMIGICAAIYAVVGRMTDFGLTFLGVAFFPAVVIPAVFAVLFGPWVGGFGAAIGIFIRDMLFHGNPFLSLSAGVPPNFIVFFIIGLMAGRNIDMKKIVTSAALACIVVAAGLLLPTVISPNEFAAATGLSTNHILLVFISTVVVSLAVIVVVSKRWQQWRSYAVGSVIGMAAGAALLSVSYWGYSQLFFDPTGYVAAPVAASFIPILFVWTFVTEIPFVLLVGPPIINACYKAFPSLKLRLSTKNKAKIIE